MTTRRLALGLPLSGHVRNLDDGRVELLIEGEPAILDGLLGAIHREFGAAIRERSESFDTSGDPPLAGFSIR